MIDPLSAMEIGSGATGTSGIGADTGVDAASGAGVGNGGFDAPVHEESGPPDVAATAEVPRLEARVLEGYQEIESRVSDLCERSRELSNRMTEELRHAGTDADRSAIIERHASLRQELSFEMLAIQARTQEQAFMLQTSSKVVEHAVSSAKTILQTQA